MNRVSVFKHSSKNKWVVETQDEQENLVAETFQTREEAMAKYNELVKDLDVSQQKIFLTE